MIKGFKLEKEILEESLLKSSFTFGFELEAVAEASYYSDYDTSDDEGYYDDEEEDHYIESSEMSRAIDNNLERLLNKNQDVWASGTMQEDGSLSASDSDDFCFEWASPVFEFTPKNVKRTIDFLDGLSDIGIYTNNSCGFHHHLSWKGITERDMIWTYTNLVMDEEFINSMLQLETRNGKTINMKSDWAKTGPLSDLRNAIKEKDWVTALRFYNDDKYRLFRIHPYGTIEWRGPRKFLDYRNLEYIKDFYKKFNSLISKVIKCQDMKTIYGTTITKEEFFNSLKEAQKDKNAPRPDDDMRDNMEFLYRTGTYRGDRRIRLKRDKTDKTTYISDRHMAALKKKPELLYNEIMKCKNLTDFSILIKNNDFTTVFNKLAKDIVPAKDKDFLDKLMAIGLNISDDISELNQYIGGKMVALLDTTKLLEKYKKVIAESTNTEAFIRFISYAMENNVELSFNEFYALLRNYAIKGNSKKQLCLEADTIFNYATRQNSQYTDSEILSIANLFLKLEFQIGFKTASSNGIVNIAKKVVTGEKERNRWNENILGALFEKRLPIFLSYLLPTTNEDILKGIVAVIRSQGYDDSYLQPELRKTLKTWLS